MRRAMGLTLVLALTTGPAWAQATPAEGEPTLELGIQQIKDGNFQAALVTLDALIGKLTPVAATRAKDLSKAYLQRGIAYVGLAQEEQAKASFREALKHDKDLRLSEKEFPPRVVRVFEAARKGKSKSVLYATGGIGAGALIAGGAALAAGGAAAAATQSARASIGFVSSRPPPGSAIEGFTGLSLMSMTLRLVCASDAPGSLFVELHTDGGATCVTLVASTGPIQPGQAVNVTATLHSTSLVDACVPTRPIPVSVTAGAFIFGCLADTSLILRADLAVSYQLVP